MTAFGLDFSTTLAGLLVGTLVGMTGIGGGALMAPILILIVGVRPIYAVGTDLVYAAVAKVFGAWQHHRLGHVDMRVVVAMGVGSVPGSLLGVALLVRARDQLGGDVDQLVLHVLGIVLILVALSIFVRMLPWFRAAREAAPTSAQLSRRQLMLLPFAGALIGLLVGLTSVGSGSLVVAFLSLTVALPVRRLVGTDVFHGALLSGAAAIAHASAGNVDVPLTLSLLLGAIPGILVGSRLTARMPERAVGTVMAVALLITGAKLV